IYDPKTNAWSAIGNYPEDSFADAPTELLPNGQVIAGAGVSTYSYDPSTGAWTSTGNKLRNDGGDEETWLLLPDGSVLSYDIFSSIETGISHAQRYVPSSNAWVDTSTVPVMLTSTAV